MAVLSLPSRACSNWRTFATCLCCSVQLLSQHQFYEPVSFENTSSTKESLFCSASHSIYTVLEVWFKTCNNSANVCVNFLISQIPSVFGPHSKRERSPFNVCSVLFFSLLPPLAQNGLLYILDRDIWPKPTLVGHMCRFNCFYSLNLKSVTKSRCLLLSFSLNEALT
jgi:hypothetical protein